MPYSAYNLTVVCPNHGAYQVPMWNVTVSRDGTVQGYTGSDAAFCPTCDSAVETLGVVTSL